MKFGSEMPQRHTQEHEQPPVPPIESGELRTEGASLTQRYYALLEKLESAKGEEKTKLEEQKTQLEAEMRKQG